MHRRRWGVLLPAAAAALCLLTLVAAPSASAGRPMSALTESNKVLTFDATAPGTINSTLQITGIGTDQLVGIDYRPVTGQLYGLRTNGSFARLVRINSSGVATQVGVPFALSGTEVGFDFDPVADRIRITSPADVNLSVNPDNGAVTTQTPLNPSNPNVVGSAYTNNFDGATSTTLNAIDSATDALYTQDPPADGTLSQVGPLGVDTSGLVGFDTDPLIPNLGYAALTVGGTPQLHEIDLATGDATLVGDVGGGEQIRGLAALTGNPQLIGLTDNNVLHTFSAADPGTISSNVTATGRADPGTIGSNVTVTGLQPGEKLVMGDFRPATGELLCASDQGRIYRIDRITGAATQVGSDIFAMNGTSFGSDVDPVADRLRAVSDAEQNLRLNPGDGTVQSDSALNPAGTVVGAGYTNGFNGAVNTTLFGIDSGSDMLVRVGGVNGNPSPNLGAVTNIGSLGVNAADIAGFAIAPGNIGLGTLTVSGVTNLYAMDLLFGGARLIGRIGDGTTPYRALTVAYPGNLGFDAKSITVNEDQKVVGVPVNRTAGDLGPVSARFVTADGTAQAGRDYIGTKLDVLFRDRIRAANVPIEVVNNSLADGNRTLTATLGNTTGGGGLGPLSKFTVRILDDDTAQGGAGPAPSPLVAPILPVTPPGTGGSIPAKGTFKIADNQSPRPLNRIFFSYNYFSNIGGLTTFNGSVPGIERIFLQGAGASRTFRLKAVRKNIVANRRTRIRMRIPRKAYRAMRRAFRRGRKKPFKVNIRATVAGQTGRGTVRLGPPSRKRR